MKGYKDDCVFAHRGDYGLVGDTFNGEIWIDDEGKIITINYMSAEESKLNDAQTAKLKSLVHPSVNEWEKNILVGRSNNLTIRVDRTVKGLRYASWSKGHSMAEKPDLIIFNGAEEAQGTMGGSTWTFKNGNWTYVIDDVRSCENEDQCGLFLRLYLKSAEKDIIRLK